jgi:Helix-turn-helix domain
MTKDKTQLDRIIEILERDGQIDNFYAIHNRISLRLGARIWDLRARGYRIETEEKSDKNTIYRLIDTPKPEQLTLV